MVASGLNDEMLYVSHIRLAIHFISALGLLCFTFWFAMMLLVKEDQKMVNPSLKTFTNIVLIVLVVQLVFGAFMAGLKAANFATTWPSINGEWIPSSMWNDSWKTFTHDPLAVHFIHRNLAYVLTLLVGVWYYQAKKVSGGSWFEFTKKLPLVIVVAQVVLGILTVLNANNAQALLWLGVAHQFTGMIFLIVMVALAYLIRKK
jgi:cytochrome c oxidase assembly protein subunit 15